MFCIAEITNDYNLWWNKVLHALLDLTLQHKCSDHIGMLKLTTKYLIQLGKPLNYKEKHQYSIFL
jgi:hypothetical protein